MQASQPDRGEKESQDKDNPALNGWIERSTCIRTMTVHGCSLQGHILFSSKPSFADN